MTECISWEEQCHLAYERGQARVPAEVRMREDAWRELPGAVRNLVGAIDAGVVVTPGMPGFELVRRLVETVAGV